MSSSSTADTQLIIARAYGTPEENNVNAAADACIACSGTLSAEAEWMARRLLSAHGPASRPVMLLQPLPARVTMVYTDITALMVDGIVNAANVGMLGCFVPGHPCVDQAIHRAAGPGLRRECWMQLLNQRHENGGKGGHSAAPDPQVMVTQGHCLPAKYVLHVVAPYGTEPTWQAQLAACYTACCKQAVKLQMRTLAFCCLGTGLFGCDARKAAAVAVETVTAWQATAPAGAAVLSIVFCTFTPEAREAYVALGVPVAGTVPHTAYV